MAKYVKFGIRHWTRYKRKILSNTVLRSINTTCVRIWQYQGVKQHDSFTCRLGLATVSTYSIKH